jgi:hypothetical protein
MTQPEPRTRNIASDLRQQIVSGTLGPGALPRSVASSFMLRDLRRCWALASCVGRPLPARSAHHVGDQRDASDH